MVIDERNSLNNNGIIPLPKVIVLTLNWNGKEDCLECLASLKKLDYPNFAIVVVDNASTDGSVKTIMEKFPDVTIIQNTENLGYARGFNKGIEYALTNEAEYVLILNNDTIIDEIALKELIKVAELNPINGIISGKVYDYKNPDTLQVIGKNVNLLTGSVLNIGSGEFDHGQYDKITEFKYLDDVFWLVRSNVFKKVGMYDPNFFLHYEETDLCARANKHFKLLFAPSAKIWHKGSKSSGGPGSPLQRYFLARNHIIFIHRNSSFLQSLFFFLYLFCFRIPLTIVSCVKNRRNNCILPYLKGTISGMKWVFIHILPQRG